MVSEQMEESLRREIEGYVESRLSGIKQEIAQLQTQLNESLKRVLESEGEAQWDGSLAASIAEHLRAAHERGIELAASESTRTQASSDMAIVKAAIEEIEGQKSQAEVLKTLVNRASSFAPRIVFFVVKGDQIRGWRARGLEGSVGDNSVQQITFPSSADTMVSEVVKSRTTWSGNPNSHADDHLLLNRLSEQPPQRIVAVPLVVRGRAVAVLYADSAALDADAINLEALETLVRVAGMAVGLLSVSQAPVKSQPSPEPTQTSQEAAPEAEPETEAATPTDLPAYTPVRVYDEPGQAEPVAEEASQELPTAEPVAVLPDAELPAAEPESAAATPIEYDVIEPTPVESPMVEEPAAETLSMADAPAAGTAGAPSSGRRRGTYDAALPVDVSDEDEKRQHHDARRFARLLVSEIKLYNEQKVIEGRTQGNLYERLREYIDRSREMYDKRVKAGVTAKYDYFHHELINTLAAGDASKLGEAYPGTVVSA
ncbi:MAG: hypothetical protein JWM21_542 [Acidobacteria bacterium]|nr:hypothetical protein [Acidobacteriota bacterium]